MKISGKLREKIKEFRKSEEVLKKDGLAETVDQLIDSYQHDYLPDKHDLTNLLDTL